MTISIISVVGIFIGIMGLILAIIFYIKSKQIKSISYSIRSFGLLSNSVSSLSNFAATYKNQPLTTLTATKILFWNSGNVVISNDDIATIDPLSIALAEDSIILDATVTESSLQSNQVNIEVSATKQNLAKISFDYLGSHEGSLVLLLHMSKPDSQINMLGTLKGFDSPQLFSPSKTIKLLSKILPAFGGLSLGIGFADPSNWINWLVAAVVFIIVVSSGVTVDSVVERMTGRKIDKSFRKPFDPIDFSSS